MKKNKIIILIMCAIMIFSLVGCSSSVSKDLAMEGISMDSVSGSGFLGMNSSTSKGDYYYDSNYETEVAPSAPKEEATEDSTITDNNEQYLEKKIVYTADVSTQTKDMAKAREAIEKMIADLEAYISDESTSTNGSIDSNYRSKNTYLTIKIPSKNFHTFLDGIESENIFVENMSKNSTDYSTQYYDKQSRIDSLKIQQDRLLEMLKQATDVKTMLDIESRLSSVRYEIESLTKELKYIDSNVQYSTINLRIREVVKYEENNFQSKTFWEELKEEIFDSADNFIDFSKELLFAFINLFPYIVIIIIIFTVVRKIRRKRKKIKNAKMTLKDDEIKK